MYATRRETEKLLSRMPLLPDYWKFSRFMVANIEHKVHQHSRFGCWDDKKYLNPMSVIRWARKNGLSVKKHNGPLDAWEFSVVR